MNDININEIIASPGAERTIIANCMSNPNVIIDCEAEGLSPKHFAIEANRIIYSAIVFLFTKNIKVDALSILNVIKDEKAKQEIEKLGGLEYLLLLQQSPTSYNMRLFCQEIMSCYTRRRIYNDCVDIQQKVIDDNKNDVDAMLSFLNQKVTDITLDSSKVVEAYKMGDNLDKRLQSYIEEPTLVRGIPTGFRKFDAITGGGEAGDLIITAAESKTGKSALNLNWAKFIAIDLKLPILWIDSEQSEEEQETRLLSIISGLPEREEIKSGMYAQDTGFGKADDKIKRIVYATKLMNEAQFFHIYMPDFTFEKINALTRKFYLKHGIVALFFDYINFNPVLMAQNRNMRDDLILTNLAIGLKQIAGDMKIPIFTAVQENRSGYGGVEKDAKNIGGSIGILQKATKLLFLRNKTEQELALEGGRQGNQKLIIKYARHSSGDAEIDMMYDKQRISMFEI